MTQQQARDLRDAVTAADHVRGDEHARVTLVEYGDYECPFCVKAYPVIEREREAFGSLGN